MRPRKIEKRAKERINFLGDGESERRSEAEERENEVAQKRRVSARRVRAAFGSEISSRELPLGYCLNGKDSVSFVVADH